MQVEIDALALDSAGRIEEDLLCAKCGYNLRGLLPAECCVECGASIEFETVAFYLRFADAAWLRKLAEGALVMAFGVGMLTIAPLLLFGASLIDRGGSCSGALLFFWVTALAAVILNGVHKITTPWKNDLVGPHTLKYRGASQVSITIFCFAVWAACLAIGVGTILKFELLQVVIEPFFLIIALAAGLIGGAVLAAYLMSLADRLGDKSLRRRVAINSRISIYSVLLMFLAIMAGSLLFRFVRLGGFFLRR